MTAATKFGLAGLGVVLMAGCGFLTNEHLFTGFGVVTGRLRVMDGGAPGALVFVLGAPRDKVLSVRDGSFALSANAGEDLSLVVLWGATHGIRMSFDLADGGELNLGELDLQPLGLLMGRVEDAQPGAVEVAVEGTPLVARPGSSGGFSMSLPPGEWRLSASAPGKLPTAPWDVQVDAFGVSASPVVVLQPDPGYVCRPDEPRVEHFSQGGGGAVDILLIIDNTGSMVGKQLPLAQSFRSIARSLEGAAVDYRLAVITPGMESLGCPPCSEIFPGSCINETGESGRFQDRKGHIVEGTETNPEFDFVTDPACRVVTPSNLDCLYDEAEERGIALVGTAGCGYERPLAAMRQALQPNMLDTCNAGFLRPHAKLAVIAFDDEEDCGEVGDVTEGLPEAGGTICYFASKGKDGDGASEDSTGKPYALTPLHEYRDFLVDVKGGFLGMVSFSAVVGLEDPSHPEDTEISFDTSSGAAKVVPACSIPNCTNPFYCNGYPAPRLVALAGMLSGTAETICRADYSDALLQVAGISTGVRRVFPLSAPPASEAGIEVKVDDEAAGGWELRQETGAIGFEEGSVPAAYGLVQIRYPPGCP